MFNHDKTNLISIKCSKIRTRQRKNERKHKGNRQVDICYNINTHINWALKNMA